MLKTKSGFTIVELLIVIVVIGILAAITIAAYNGVQEKARFAKMRSELNSINKALQLYYADNGSYPITPSGGNGEPCSTGSWCGYLHSTGDSFIAGLAPAYISVIPQLPASNHNSDTYLYRSPTGVDYKLIRLVQGELSSAEKAAMADLMTTSSDCSDSLINNGRWGYWSSNASKCW